MHVRSLCTDELYTLATRWFAVSSHFDSQPFVFYLKPERFAIPVVVWFHCVQKSNSNCIQWQHVNENFVSCNCRYSSVRSLASSRARDIVRNSSESFVLPPLRSTFAATAIGQSIRQFRRNWSLRLSGADSGEQPGVWRIGQLTFRGATVGDVLKPLCRCIISWKLTARKTDREREDRQTELSRRMTTPKRAFVQ